MNITGTTVDKAVALYRQLQTIKDGIENEAKVKTDEIKAKMQTLENWLSEKAIADGTESYRTESGTVFWQNAPYCSVADWEAAFSYILEHAKWHLLTKGVSKTAITDEIKETGAVPPGLNYGTKRTMHIRKPTAKE